MTDRQTSDSSQNGEPIYCTECGVRMGVAHSGYKLEDAGSVAETSVLKGWYKGECLFSLSFVCNDCEEHTDSSRSEGSR